MLIQIEYDSPARILVRVVMVLWAILFQGLFLCPHVVMLAEEQSLGEQRLTWECRWTKDIITIDGLASEPAWQPAQAINRFGMPWLSPDTTSAKSATRAKLLWDREALYFFAELDDLDLFSEVKEHDGMTWLDDCFALLLKPAADKPGYYEFHVNSSNTSLDIFVPRHSPDSYSVCKSNRPFHFKSMVTVSGTRENHTDVDKGWTVEGRVLWQDFISTGGRPVVNEIWRFAMCRYNRTQGKAVELSTCSSLTQPDIHQHAGYADLHFVGPPSVPNTFPPKIVWTASRVVGSPEPLKPFQLVRAFPDLPVDFPICVKPIPGTDRMLLVHQPVGNRYTRLLMASVQEDVDSYQVLMDVTKNQRLVYDIAFHPQFSENGYVFLGLNEQNAKLKKRTRVVRYKMQPVTPFVFDKNSEKIIIEWPSDGHDGGAMAFGNDGMLYVTSGDGTNESDVDLVGQRLDTLRAKVLRIDVDRGEEGRAYAVPRDNPFVGVAGVRPETWAFGFRNPWRIAVDPDTGNIWVGNNGQDLWEQVYLVQRGANYGWSAYEGSHPFYLDRQNDTVPLSLPIFEHHHAESRSLTGGLVYHGNDFPELAGVYIYGDYSTGKLWGGKQDAEEVVWHQELADTTAKIAYISNDHLEELLITSHAKLQEGGGLFRLERTPDLNRKSKFPRRLTETGLFQSVAGHKVQPGLIPYTVNFPAWHDGAIAERFLGLPAAPDSNGEPVVPKINFSPQNSWSFPEGTVLVQSLSVETEAGVATSRRWVETRLLTLQRGNWGAYSYLWNDEQTDATLVQETGVTKTVEVREDDQVFQRTWHVPSRSECLSCHSRQAGFVLGMTTLQSNRQAEIGTAQMNQIALFEHWDIFNVSWLGEANEAWHRDFRDIYLRRKTQEHQQKDDENIEKYVRKRVAELNEVVDQRSPPPMSMLYHASSQYERLLQSHDEQVPLRDQARAYLHVNCSNCHVTNGGGNARIELQFGLDDELLNLINVKPLHATYGVSGAQLVAPGAPHRSILNYRISTIGSGRMPRVGSHQIDREGARLLRRWIVEMGAAAPDTNKQKVSDSKQSEGLSEDLRSQVAELGSTDPEMALSLATDLMSTTSGALALIEAIDEKWLSHALSYAIIEIGVVCSNPFVQRLFEAYLPEEQRSIRLGPTVDAQQILQLEGNAVHGKQLLLHSKILTCLQCHRFAGQGHAVGPDLAQVKKETSREQLLDSLLDPSKNVADKFVTYFVATDDGKTYTGLMAEQSDSEIVLKQPGGMAFRIPRVEIEEMIPQSKSLMPDQLLKDLTAQQAADLIDFLHSLLQNNSGNNPPSSQKEKTGSGTGRDPAAP